MKNKKDWWKDKGGFFGELYYTGDDSLDGPYYERKLDRKERTVEEVEGVVNLCSLNKGDKILDCPCGWGRHSIKLSKLGFDVTGIDINSFELNIAKEEAKKMGVKAKFVKKDMRNIKNQEEFDAVINLWYSFGFFSEEADNFLSLQNFYNSLKKGGKFLMHTHRNPSWILKGEQKEFEKRALRGGGFLRQIEFYNQKNKRNYGVWVVEKGEKVEAGYYSMRNYSKEEFVKMCKKVGFKKVDVYSGWKGEKYDPNSRYLIVVATK